MSFVSSSPIPFSLSGFIVTGFEPARITQVWDEMFKLIEEGKLKPVVYSERFKLEDLSVGLAALENRKTWGKVIVRVRENDERTKL